jgi:uncharacterized protein YjbI with pentapeptide repeats
MGVDLEDCELAISQSREFAANAGVQWLYCDMSSCFGQTSPYFAHRFERVLMRGANFAGAVFGDVGFVECIGEIQLNHAYLFNCVASRCDFRRATFLSAELGQMRFGDCDLQGVNFKRARMRGSEIKSCNLQLTKFDSSFLLDTQFQESKKADMAVFTFVIIDDETTLPREWEERPHVNVPQDSDTGAESTPEAQLRPSSGRFPRSLSTMC